MTFHKHVAKELCISHWFPRSRDSKNNFVLHKAPLSQGLNTLAAEEGGTIQNHLKLKEIKTGIMNLQ